MDNLLDDFHGLAPWIFAALLLAAGCCDARSYLIPNRLSIFIVLLYAGYVLSASGDVDATGAVATAVAVLLVGAGLFAANLMGGGDVKLMATAALWAGPAYVFSFLTVMAMTGGVLSLAVLLRPHLANFAGRGVATHSRRVPYGVAIAAGGLLVAARLVGF